MPEVKLFIATSLDGFIAERDGGVDWLFTDNDYGYTSFFDSIETLIMGRRTYEQVLGFGEWPYGEKPTYVFTRGAPGGDHPHVEFVSSDAGPLVEKLRHRSSGDIWLVGGAALVSVFRELHLIDEYILSLCIPCYWAMAYPCSSAHSQGKACGYKKSSLLRAG